MRTTVSVIVVIVLIALGVWYAQQPKQNTIEPAPVAQNPTTVPSAPDSPSTAATGVVDAGATVGGSVSNTNPFTTKVNPYDGYKNPFAN